MIINNTNHTISFSLFSQFPELVCYFSTRQLGDLDIRKNDSPKLHLKKMSDVPNITLMQQTHKNLVHVVNKSNTNQLIGEVDGSVTVEKNLYLGVCVADCVPLFFYEPMHHIIGIAHAGWKGTAGNIAKEIILHCMALGAKVKNIYVAVGPHIGACCYDIPQERFMLLSKTFNHNPLTVFSSNGKYYFDLARANYNQLVNSGIEPSHIDIPITCTSCQNDQFFSYRKDSRETFGEMLGIIGLREKM